MMKTTRQFIAVALFGMILIAGANTLQVGATGVTIEEDLSVTPSVISFETVFPQEILERTLSIRLAQGFTSSWGGDTCGGSGGEGGGASGGNSSIPDPRSVWDRLRLLGGGSSGTNAQGIQGNDQNATSNSGGGQRCDPKKDVEYRITQRPKPRTESHIERAYCAEHPEDLTRCYPSLCPYLSKTPDGTPENDHGVPSFHDSAATSSVATGVLTKSGNDVEDKWTIDLHVPCYEGECAQDWARYVRAANPDADPAKYMLDPSLHGQTFGCDLVVKVVKTNGGEEKPKPAKWNLDFWKEHTEFTSSVFGTKLNGSLTVGSSTHTRVVTNDPGNGQSRLFGVWFSDTNKKTTGAVRAVKDIIRMRLLPVLVSAKLNCAVLGCTADMQGKIALADSAYAAGNTVQMELRRNQLKTLLQSYVGDPIPPELGAVGASTLADSGARANKVFWNSP